MCTQQLKPLLVAYLLAGRSSGSGFDQVNGSVPSPAVTKGNGRRRRDTRDVNELVDVVFSWRIAVSGKGADFDQRVVVVTPYSPMVLPGWADGPG
ncbi:hypothetical protein ACFRAR_16595 [Kitasatospora sp. NPDC056651]|uniref:hypothetical protein n=1 Tax=Kitasatospora sp. NPDC056651 TaxID=3345892 RepID=UPI0036A7F189